MNTEVQAPITEAPTNAPAPKNDAEAQQQVALAPVVTEPTPEEKAKAAEGEEKKKNRTRDYINRINRENAELRQRAAALEAAQQAPQRTPNWSQPADPRQRQGVEDTGPTLEEFGYDVNAHQQARDRWLIEQTTRQFQQSQQQQDYVRQQQTILTTYEQRAAEFTDQHPDFLEAVGSIDPHFLTPDLQLAVMSHARGPEIAYQLANDDEALFHLASIRADLLPAAVNRIALRLSAAPQAGNTPPVIAPTPPKSLTQAPPPVPTVGGRSPSPVSAEKLTDDDWYARRKEQQRKR
jgi:hypothetical protein